eukprot:scaffold436_cov367-Prasinococcus_capsulatus_cf.AAC.3
MASIQWRAWGGREGVNVDTLNIIRIPGRAPNLILGWGQARALPAPPLAGLARAHMVVAHACQRRRRALASTAPEWRAARPRAPTGSPRSLLRVSPRLPTGARAHAPPRPVLALRCLCATPLDVLVLWPVCKRHCAARLVRGQAASVLVADPLPPEPTLARPRPLVADGPPSPCALPSGLTMASARGLGREAVPVIAIGVLCTYKYKKAGTQSRLVFTYE